MPRPKKVKSQAKVGAMQSNLAITAWRTAAREMGYLTKGAFKPIPAKGSPEHTAIKERQKVVLERLKAEAPPAPPAEPVAQAPTVASEAKADTVDAAPQPTKNKPAKPKKPKTTEPKTMKKKAKAAADDVPDAAPLPPAPTPPPNPRCYIPTEHYVMCAGNLTKPAPSVRLPPLPPAPTDSKSSTASVALQAAA